MAQISNIFERILFPLKSMTLKNFTFSYPSNHFGRNHGTKHHITKMLEK